MNVRFQDRKSFEFVDLINPKRFRTWEGKVPSNKIDLLEQRYGPLFDMPMLQSQLIFLYRDEDFHKENSMELLKYIFQFNLQSCLSEVVKFLIMNGIFAVSNPSVERSFSCLKWVKTYLRTTMGQNLLSCLCRMHLQSKEGLLVGETT